MDDTEKTVPSTLRVEANPAQLLSDALAIQIIETR